MISVFVKNQSKYSINSNKIKLALTTLLEQRGVVSKTKVSVAIVNEKKMLDISRKYLKDDKVHNVLSFTYDEVKENFVYPPDNSKYLGEIIVCYSKAKEEARVEGISTDDRIVDLVKHGALHLIGIHHDKH